MRSSIFCAERCQLITQPYAEVFDLAGRTGGREDRVVVERVPDVELIWVDSDDWAVP